MVSFLVVLMSIAMLFWLYTETVEWTALTFYEAERGLFALRTAPRFETEEANLMPVLLEHPESR